MNEDIKILRAVHGSARADGDATFGRVTFRLSRSPERRWLELFEATKDQGMVAEERGNEFLLHVESAPGEVANRRDAALALIADINGRRRDEVAQQSQLARERNNNKRTIEDALNQELEELKFE